VNRRGSDGKPERGVDVGAFIAGVVDEVARRALPEAALDGGTSG
jgi:hypothetical protein